MQQHHPTLPPSAFPAILQCSAFKPSNETGSDATKGNALHDYTTSLVAGFEPEESKLIDAQDAEDCRWAAQFAKDWLQTNFPLSSIDFCALEEVHNPTDGEVITFGHSDIATDECIIDFKGCLDFKPEKHEEQLAMYALARMDKSNRDMCRCIEIYIKPRKFEEYTYTRVEAISVLLEVLMRKKDPKPTQCSYCKWCGDFGTCPAVQKGLISMAESQGLVNAQDIVNPGSITDPILMSKAFLFYKQVLEPWIDNLKDAAIAMSEKAPIPGLVRNEKAGRQSISDAKKAFYLLNERYPQITDSDFLGVASLSIPELSKVLAAKTEMTQEAARSSVEEVLKPVIEEGKKSVSLSVEKVKKSKK